ncbi:MAG: CheR family methyltransferase [Halobacteriales archaeon]
MSAGCADGREAYSVAVTGLERGLDVRVEGVDVDPRAIQTSRRGRYEDVDVERIESMSYVDEADRYVEETDDGYEVTDVLRAVTSFHRSDVMEAMESLRFDLVLCRNLLIYVDVDRKRGFLDKLRDLVAAGGLLVLGKTERLPRDMEDDLEVVDRSNRVYRRRR